MPSAHLAFSPLKRLLGIEVVAVVTRGAVGAMHEPLSRPQGGLAIGLHDPDGRTVGYAGRRFDRAGRNARSLTAFTTPLRACIRG